ETATADRPSRAVGYRHAAGDRVPGDGRGVGHLRRGDTRDPGREAAPGHNGPNHRDRTNCRGGREIPDGCGEVAMISPVRQDALRLLAQLSELAPDVRLGQLLVNLSYLARGMTVEAIWDMEDEELVEAATRHVEQWKAL